MLSVSKNKRYLLKDGKFFPYLADTAWTLLQRLSREEIIYYLDKRKSQGFNAVQVSAISELDGIRVPNREGNLPFKSGEVGRPDNNYFSVLTFLADECEKRDMVLVLLPTWGDKFNKKWGIGPEIFTPENSFLYGNYLANLIDKRENIIWMLGGDRPIENDTHRKIIDEMSRGIRSGEAVKHLITYHPCGEASSSDYLCGVNYIDFHSLQSGHSFGGYNSHNMIEKTISIDNKPCLDAECFYEDFPIGFDIAWNYRLNDSDIRRRIYKNMMSGALGHTYGHQSVWCFRNETDLEYLYDWKEALERPMAKMMNNINKLISMIDMTTLKTEKIACDASGAVGDGFALVYIENNEPVFIDVDGKYNIKKACWFNPVSGEVIQYDDIPQKNITATSPFNHDAVLILYLK